MVEYLGCSLDTKLIEESMAMKSLGKIRTKLQLFYRQNHFYRQNDVGCCIIQAHFDYTFNSWYLLFSQKIKEKIQLTQNKCIRFCLKLSSKQHLRCTEITYKNCEIRTLLLPKYKSWLRVCLLIPGQHCLTQLFQAWSNIEPKTIVNFGYL